MELNRTMEQWRGCDPEAMAYHMSEAATMYAFKDAKADILALHAENERLRAQAQHESDCAEAHKTEADRLRDENARLRVDAERYRWLKSMASEQDDTYIVFPEIDAWDYQPGPQLNDKFATLDAAIDAAMQNGE